jgi:hypothetical protein
MDRLTLLIRHVGGSNSNADSFYGPRFLRLSVTSVSAGLTRYKQVASASVYILSSSSYVSILFVFLAFCPVSVRFNGRV